MSFFGKLLGRRSAEEERARDAFVTRVEEEVEQEARVGQSAAGDPPPEDRFEMLAAGFEEDQYAEYDAHGGRVKEALLLLHDGEFKQARVLLEEIVTAADAPRYLFFDLGRARLADADLEQGASALETFLSRLHPDEGGDARLHALIELAAVQQSRNDFDGAVAHYEAALAAMPNDARPYLAMGHFFRTQGLAEEALEVLEAGLGVVTAQGPKWRIWQELGLTHADSGRDDQAVELLEQAMDFLLTRQELDLPPEGAVRLAQLHEKMGEPGRALDLYTLLCNGSDEANHWLYQLEAGRLMSGVGLADDARRALARALELAPDDAARAKVAELTTQGSAQAKPTTV